MTKRWHTTLGVGSRHLNRAQTRSGATQAVCAVNRLTAVLLHELRSRGSVGSPAEDTPMKVQVPVIVKDPEVSDYKGIHPTEIVDIDEDRCLDGPISPRVAVLDFDPKSGRLESGVPFVAAADPRKPGSYDIPDPLTSAGGPISREAAAVSLFGTIHKTLQLFEEPDALGREVTWAFDSPQLLAVPRAGDWPNAFYERESRSVQFFSFDSGGRTVFTGHSQDIVAHETAHAIVDGVAPDLYHVGWRGLKGLLTRPPPDLGSTRRPSPPGRRSSAHPALRTAISGT